ncbi:hypothetical protein GC105_02940 [Alkalibaculum sp. M08DMB]|uniref:YlbF family regulator n=1 Tax=Alkalibaculum sporogenes TaxID=2655001 RepID=A0A6A7K5T5_9FIRM|nr:YlbF family regulator [Alkalibaculum sporogenes]MPW24745.1 hypothetical protein [Alkalibaculum sporogenes]
MSISNIARSLGKELISTKEYKIMKDKKEKLFSHSKLGQHAKRYETKQLNIMNMKVPPNKKQSLLSNLTVEYKTLLSTNEMKEYLASITEFQKRTFLMFDTLHRELNKTING